MPPKIMQEKSANFITQAEELLEHNRPMDALKLLRENMECSQTQHYTYFLMSQACSDLEMYTESLTFLLEAQRLDPKNSRYNEKIALHFYKNADYQESYKYFKQIGIMFIDSVDSLNAYAVCAEKTDNESDCIEALERSLSMESGQHDLEKKLREMKGKITGKTSSRKKKIAFICAKELDNFIDDIIDGLSSVYNTEKFVVSEKNGVKKAVEWCDIAWFEWCNEVAVFGTNYCSFQGKRTLIRLHSYEAFDQFPSQIKWGKVDKLIFVSPHIKEIVKKSIPDIDSKVECEVVYNGLDLSKFDFSEKSPGKDIAMVCKINHKKNPELALQIMKSLTDRDTDYKLHIAGNITDMRYEYYINYMINTMGLEKNVVFYDWIDDMNEWLQDKQYILSTSIHEGHAYNIMEAMAAGLKPVIHNYFGAEHTIPEYAIFNTVDEAVDLIESPTYDSKSYREYVEGFSLERQINTIDKILSRIFN